MYKLDIFYEKVYQKFNFIHAINTSYNTTCFKINYIDKDMVLFNLNFISINGFILIIKLLSSDFLYI